MRASSIRRNDKPVVFRTLDIGSDKVLPYMKRADEPNPALGWRAIRVGLDRPGMMRMQVQALIRGAKGRPLHVMFPFVAEASEFEAARELVMRELAREAALGHAVPASVKVGAMLETPSLAFGPDRFFELTDFISIGGNDLKQFFFAADRENELVRRRYDMMSSSFLGFLEQIVQRCAAHGTPLSFCGEDAGRPLEALALAAIGMRSLSMRPASIGPVKALLRTVDLSRVRAVIDTARRAGQPSVRPALEAWLGQQDAWAVAAWPAAGAALHGAEGWDKARRDCTGPEPCPHVDRQGDRAPRGASGADRGGRGRAGAAGGEALGDPRVHGAAERGGRDRGRADDLGDADADGAARRRGDRRRRRRAGARERAGGAGRVLHRAEGRGIDGRSLRD